MYLVAAILLTCGIQSCSVNLTRGNGNLVEKEFTIADYHTLYFSGGATLIYEQNAEAAPYLKIKTDENILPLLTIRSDNNSLSIGNEGNISPTQYYIYTNSSDLKNFQISGSLKAHLKGKLSTDRLTIQIAGSGDLVADQVECDEVRASIAGSGDIKLAGKTEKLHGQIAGSGDINTLGMEADDVKCSVSGSGNFTVHAAKYLNVSVSGSGDVRYAGNPQVKQSISGSGSVRSIN